MAAGGAAGARGRSRTEGRGPGRQRRRLPGRCAKVSRESGAAQDAEETRPATRSQERGGPRTPSAAASHKGADGRPSKRPKCDKNTPVKSEIEGLTSGSGNLDALGETPKPSDGDPRSEDPGDRNTTPEKKGESIPGTKEGQQGKEHNVPLEPRAVESSSVPPAVGSDGKLCSRACCSTDESCESVPSDGSGSEDGDLPKKPVQLDNSAFLDEDSNQPMPVARFFGDVQFIQDFPAAAVPSTAMSRREFRNLHFIAKEEEEEEEEEEYVV